jgi:hypothetical protein
MTAVVLAILSVFSMGSGNFASTASIILILDAYIGLAAFTAKNSVKINSAIKSLTASNLIDCEDEEFVRA